LIGSFVALLHCTQAALACAQDSSAARPSNPNGLNRLYVEKVVVHGNTKTEEDIILREMRLKEGDLVDPGLLDYDINRVYSLGIFSRVDASIEPSRDSLAVVNINVVESLAIIPFPIIGIKDRDWDKFYFGAGLLHNNFRGRNEKVMVAGALGYDPWATIRYQNPRIDRENNLFFIGQVGFSRIQNKSIYSGGPNLDYDEQHLTASITVGKRLGLFSYPWVMLNYNDIRVSEPGTGRTLSARGRDEFLTAGVGFTYDSRDLQEYASRGTYAALSFLKYGLGESAVDYHRIGWDLRKFVPVPRLFNLTLAARTFGGVSSGGTTPLYDHLYFGYAERIRGHFTEIIEGESVLGLSAEVRIPLLKPDYFTVDYVPVPGLRVWRFGVGFALFADAGKVWFRPQTINLTNLTKGYGAGLHFLLPYGIVLRSEYAWDERRVGEYVFDLKAAF